MTWVDWRDRDWRPSKSDIISLYSLAKEGRTTKEASAYVHQQIWLRFKKESTKDLTYSEFEEVIAILSPMR